MLMWKMYSDMKKYWLANKCLFHDFELTNTNMNVGRPFRLVNLKRPSVWNNYLHM